MPRTSRDLMILFLRETWQTPNFNIRFDDVNRKT